MDTARKCPEVPEVLLNTEAAGSKVNAYSHLWPAVPRPQPRHLDSNNGHSLHQAVTGCKAHCFHQGHWQTATRL